MLTTKVSTGLGTNQSKSKDGAENIRKGQSNMAINSSVAFQSGVLRGDHPGFTKVLLSCR